MSYNWTSAATPQGRERLKELLDQGHRIVGKVGEFGRITALWKSDGGAYDIDGYISESMFHKARLDDVEFLDPDPPQPKPLTIEEMRAYCVKWCSGMGILHHDRLPARSSVVGHATVIRLNEHTWRFDGPNGNTMCYVSDNAHDHFIMIAYATIRGLERGDLGQGKEGGV